MSTWIVLQGGIPPYRVTWDVNGKTQALDSVAVEQVGPNPDSTLANGTKYSFSFTPKSAADRVTLHAVDSRVDGPPDNLNSTIIGTRSPCLITP